VAAEVRGDGRGGWWQEEVRAATMKENPRFTLNLRYFKLRGAAEIRSGRDFRFAG
jgi:hypothetical protein